MENIFYITALFYLYFGIYAVSLNLKATVNRIFMAICFCFTVQSMTAISIMINTNVKEIGIFDLILSISEYLIPMLLLKFSVELTHNNVLKNYKSLAFITYFLPVIFIVGKIFGQHDRIRTISIDNENMRVVNNTSEIIFWSYYAYIIVYVLLCVWFHLEWYIKASTVKDKKTSKILLLTSITVIALTSISCIYLNNRLTIGLISTIFGLIWVSGIWYSIIRLRLMYLKSEDAAGEMLERVNDIIIFVDIDGKVIRVNDKFCELLKYDKENEIYGKQLKFFFREPIELKDKNLREDEESNYYNKEMELVDKSGETVLVFASFSSITDKLGDLVGTLVVATDIRIMKQLEREIQERKKSEQDLIETNEKLKELDLMKTDFISMISHELRTPLTSILGFAKIMKKKLMNQINQINNDSERNINLDMLKHLFENLNIIVLEAERLTNLINDVLDIAKMESGKIEWKLQHFEMKDLAERAQAATSSLFIEKSIDFEMEVEENMSPIVADYDRILQVFINLISNSVKFTDKGTVKCIVKKINNEFIVTIEDTGIGISEENIESVFLKFKQVGDTLTNRPKGTGLGLPICKQIIEGHGGKIWVESEINRGSKFIFALPVSGMIQDARRVRLDQLAKRLSNNILESNKNISKNYDILVVDDDESISALLKEVLEAEGFVVRRASDGLQAINEVRKEKPDLIILDVMMPNMNGFDAAAILKNDPETKNIPIIMLSIIEDKERGILLGVNRYMKKPINIEELLKNIDHLLNEDNSLKKVLIVDSDIENVKMLTDILHSKGYGTVTYCKAEDLISKVKISKPNIIIMDEKIIKHKDAFSELRFANELIDVSIFLLGEEVGNEENSAI